MSELLLLDSQEITTSDQWEREVSPVMIMVGARAVEATLGLPPEEEAPYEYVVRDDFYVQAVQNGWDESDGALIDPGDNLRLTTRYGNAGYDELLSRAVIGENVAVAGLPDLYATMQRQGDTPETAAIRKRLLNPELPPLNLEQMPREHKVALSLLEQIPGAKQDPLYEIAERLLTNAIYTQYTLYGDPDIGQPNQIVGTLETPQNGTFAYYHNGLGLVEDSEDLLRHLDNVNAPTRIRLLALIAENYSDIVYGNGREADNPEAYDEKLSAELLYAHAMLLGCPEEDAQWLYDAIDLTRFDERTKTQPGRLAKDPHKRAVTASDLQVLGRRGDGVESSKRIVFENMLSARRSKATPLRQVMDRFGVWRLDTLEELESFTRTYRHEPVDSPDGATLGQVYANYLDESAEFYENYRAPEGWTLDDREAQQENAAEIRKEMELFVAAY